MESTPQVENVEKDNVENVEKPEAKDQNQQNQLAFDDDEDFNTQMLMTPNITEADQELL